MNNLTIKERILKTLLESPKTTGQIAIELGYIDNKGHGKYNIIKSDLNTLEQYGFIHRIESKKTVGAPATTYDINYDISVLRGIVRKYSSLLHVLQKNKYVLELFRTDFPLFREVGANYGDPNDLGGMIYTESVNDLRTIALVRCELSETFFKNYLMHESYLEAFIELYRAINKNNNDREKISPHTFEKISDMMFLHAVITDKINGVLDPDAIDEIRQSPYIHGIFDEDFLD